MNQTTEKLIRDVVAGDHDLREITRTAGLHALRGRMARRRMRMRATALLVPVVALAAVLLTLRPLHHSNNHGRTGTTAVEGETIPGTAIRILSDDQLLDMFQGRPVALIGPPGNQRLLLLDQNPN